MLRESSKGLKGLGDLPVSSQCNYNVFSETGQFSDEIIREREELSLLRFGHQQA